ncbi:MAG: hypothetical protein A2315_15900 [Ignavibacteria bacterium RIFOXYB2_FULL_35_12]|nr:MAG: hypothetical protein A2058_00990 [Ignavibacteria bacterium GWA2_36_19]OGU60865.1 MAG: hypothetical protein A2X60_15430 [Ignavibacteria bacterium GWF2_35_20]OGU80192.1 MAG: hypothetical protein A2254_02975 [Ignavibacteria bacterium RIFOXYA2_FULL_35_9]OGU92073.1 MAG: hypothetical protein A3K31_12730 [Ignavibacteria bacterium RIFOXYA12_FULL_35_25]OGU95708.1 MAG: hypothetical protein A2347_01515 [Ignavibacteria bacterium RIFOXYB12_FULL_35_14]OGU98845.1 MAG: hypothetical protein A2455_02610
MRVNIGCGQTPTLGWRNFDNSLSLRLAKIPFAADFLKKIGWIEQAQYEFIRFASVNNIEYGDATKGLHIKSSSVEVLYSSHMIEHLDRNGAARFLKEAFRLLQPGGLMRLTIPDIKKQVTQYNINDDADRFMELTHLCSYRPISFSQRLQLLIVGPRNHQWMYDGKSLVRLLQNFGFINAEILPAGKTNIKDYWPLDLHERESESVYVEAVKPNV